MKHKEVEVKEKFNQVEIDKNENLKKKKIKKVILICVCIIIGVNLLLLAIVMFTPSSCDETSVTSSSSKWIKSDSELIEGSNLYYYYKETPQNFIDEINKNFSLLAKNNCINVSSYNKSQLFSITNTTNNPNNVTTYTCSFGTSQICGFYLDSTDDGIIQIRTGVSINALVDAGITDVSVVYGYNALEITTALVNCAVIDEDKADEVYDDLYAYLKDGKTDFYINGLAVHGSLDSSTNIQQFTIIKIDEDKYNYSIDKSLNPVKLEY